MTTKSDAGGIGGLAIVGILGLGLYLLSRREALPPLPPPDGTGGALNLAGALGNVEMEQLTQKTLGQTLTATISWSGLTTLDGAPTAWYYRLYAGLGRPESLLPGRQFQPEGSSRFLQFNAVVGTQQTTFEFPLLQGIYVTGRKDLMFSLVARPSPQNPTQGDDVSGKWPTVASTEWREVAAKLVQDAVEIRETHIPATSIEGSFGNVSLSRAYRVGRLGM